MPTTAELGYPYLRATILLGLWAASGTPPAVLEKIGNDVRTLLKTPAFSDKHVTARGYDVAASSPEELATLLRAEITRVGEVVQAANIKPE